ncbi:MAG TPA: endonuclease/exonuclease/phosphatase family protein [Acidimicrobiales bacterium]|nr:endonuclease/exonuclease/phosphatase family protein [Acidimicrobiales bacterium]
MANGILPAIERAVLRVLTLNIWNLEGPWRQRREEIVAWLDLLAPDVVCLQEVMEAADGRNQARWLAEAGRARYHVAYGPGSHHGDATLGNAILSRWPLDEPTVVPLATSAFADDVDRVVLHARTVGIDVFCTHLSWRFDDGAIRERQVVQVAGAVRRLADPSSPLPPILAGDLNAEPDSTEVRFLTGLTSLGATSVYFQDAWRVAGGAGPGHTWDNRNPFAAASLEPDRRIDYVLVGWRRADGAGRVESAAVACDRALTGTYATDHFGVVAEIARPG